MSSRRMVSVIVSVAAMLFMTWSATGLAAPAEPAALAGVEDEYQLLANPGMEEAFIPYGFQFNGVACKVAAGWTRFGDTDPRPCWMDTRDFAYFVMGTSWVERIEGETSQVIISTEEQSAGIYQRVSGLTPGLPYGFHAAMLTIFQSSAPGVQDGAMIKWVGMDPTGGIDPNAETVVWSEPEGMDSIWDTQRRVSVVATSSTMTVFILVEAEDPGEWPYVNQSFLDSAILARTVTVSAVTPETSLSPTFTVRWDNAVGAPGATIEEYDVQWMDEANGQWVDWLTTTQQTQATFTGSWWHTYRFRARARQRYPNGAYLFSPYLPEAGAPTTVVGAKLVGNVGGNGPYGFRGASVSILGKPYTGVSRYDGRYQILVPPLEGSQTVAASNLPWLSPEPVYEVALGAGANVELDWTLRPPDDAVRNGGFEGGLGGWDVVPEQGAAMGVADPIHTGAGAAMLGGVADLGEDVGYASGVEQTVELVHSWNPNLSFWYLPEAGDGDDQFSVRLSVASDAASSQPSAGPVAEAPATPVDLVLHPSLDAEGWQHQWYSLGIGEAYFTGTVTIQFEVWNDGDDSPTTVYLDEVSAGRTPGGPFRTYLPLIGK